MKEAGAIAAGALKAAGDAVQPGITTYELNRIAHKFIKDAGAYPTFLGYNGYPAAACISINDVVIHDKKRKKQTVRAGDIVSIDIGATFNGYVGDNAATFAAGEISPEAKRLSDTTREALYKGIEAAVAGNRLGDIGHAVQKALYGTLQATVIGFSLQT